MPPLTTTPTALALNRRLERTTGTNPRYTHTARPSAFTRVLGLAVPPARARGGLVAPRQDEIRHLPATRRQAVLALARDATAFTTPVLAYAPAPAPYAVYRIRLPSTVYDLPLHTIHGAHYIRSYEAESIVLLVDDEYRPVTMDDRLCVRRAPRDTHYTL
ncbi:hypothetical protein B0H17DRAFT_1219043 [Mycena rosella]|uniref:Uncharacterized protein n=1 Tax=Mycena rosella TaxID=1033263 RepID=A0AAD7BL17_MYCRO|nr:hypothetical protein B0H17DRAFT_1219043 [Mycena rosella]